MYHTNLSIYFNLYPGNCQLLGFGCFWCRQAPLRVSWFFCPLFPPLLLTLCHPICEVFQWIEGCNVLVDCWSNVKYLVIPVYYFPSPQTEGHFDRGMGTSVSDISDKLINITDVMSWLIFLLNRENIFFNLLGWGACKGFQTDSLFIWCEWFNQLEGSF